MLPETEEIPEIVKKSVSVTVKDSGDTAIEGVTVTLTDGDSTEYTGTTESDGTCTISDVPLGEVSVKAEKTGYTDYTDTYTVVDDTNSISIVLSTE